MLSMGMWNDLAHVSFSGPLRLAMLAAVRYRKTKPLFSVAYRSFAMHPSPVLYATLIR